MSFRVRLIPLIFVASVLPVSQAMFQGCATLVDGPTEQVKVVTQPVGAHVFLNGRDVGQTPTSVVVSRWGMHRLRIEMPGYKTLELPLEKDWNDNASANIFIGGVWIIVDAVTGAIFRLDLPARTRAELQPLPDHGEPGPIFSHATLRISTSLKPDPAARRIGQMERR